MMNEDNAKEWFILGIKVLPCVLALYAFLLLVKALSGAPQTEEGTGASREMDALYSELESIQRALAEGERVDRTK